MMTEERIRHRSAPWTLNLEEPCQHICFQKKNYLIILLLMVGGQMEEEEAEETGGLLFTGGSLAVTALSAIALRGIRIQFGKRMALL